MFHFSIENNIILLICKGRHNSKRILNTLCVGLTDKTKNNEAAIDLAVSENLKIGKWISVVGLEL